MNRPEQHLAVLTVQQPVNRWTAPFTISRNVEVGYGYDFADAREAYEWMLDQAIAEGVSFSPDEWSGNEREDVIVIHWSLTQMGLA